MQSLRKITPSFCPRVRALARDAANSTISTVRRSSSTTTSIVNRFGHPAGRRPRPTTTTMTMTTAPDFLINSAVPCRAVSTETKTSLMGMRSEYVHPLSQIVLERLQSEHGEWISRTGLHEGLDLRKDGTFALRFPVSDVGGGGSSAPGSNPKAETETESPLDLSGERGSIWTTYETEERSHFLCVRKGALEGRILLQDNSKPAWHSDKKSTHERVVDAVDDMVAKIDENTNHATVPKAMRGAKEM